MRLFTHVSNGACLLQIIFLFVRPETVLQYLFMIISSESTPISLQSKDIQGATLRATRWHS
jgi:hypothetical protein